jgi:DNA polymerase (family 10)
MEGGVIIGEVAVMDNRTIAEHLRRHAWELDAEGGNLYRARAYRRAANQIIDLDEPLSLVLERGGRRGLQALPGIGSHIARTIENLLVTGAMPVCARVSAGC